MSRTASRPRWRRWRAAAPATTTGTSASTSRGSFSWMIKVSRFFQNLGLPPLIVVARLCHPSPPAAAVLFFDTGRAHAADHSAAAHGGNPADGETITIGTDGRVSPATVTIAVGRTGHLHQQSQPDRTTCNRIRIQNTRDCTQLAGRVGFLTHGDSNARPAISTRRGRAGFMTITGRTTLAS